MTQTKFIEKRLDTKQKPLTVEQLEIDRVAVRKILQHLMDVHGAEMIEIINEYPVYWVLGQLTTRQLEILLNVPARRPGESWVEINKVLANYGMTTSAYARMQEAIFKNLTIQSKLVKFIPDKPLAAG